MTSSVPPFKNKRNKSTYMEAPGGHGPYLVDFLLLQHYNNLLLSRYLLKGAEIHSTFLLKVTGEQVRLTTSS